MNLMISESASRYICAGTHTNTAVDIIWYTTGECALGHVLVARTVTGVCAILIGADPDGLKADLSAHFTKTKFVANQTVAHDDLSKVIRFADKPSEGLDLQLDVRGTPFQRLVWEALRAIPVGTTATYADLARRFGAPTSARAIARACTANRIALAIPCHRVVCSDGDLAGYRWGIERKRELIKREEMV